MSYAAGTFSSKQKQKAQLDLRSKNLKSKKVTERENIKVDRKISASKGTLKEKDVTKITSKKRPTTPKKTMETDVGKENDDDTLLSEENVPLNPIEQDTAHDTIQSTLSLPSSGSSVANQSKDQRKTELVAPKHHFTPTPTLDAYKPDESVNLLDGAIHEVIKNNILFHVKYSTLLCTGLPGTGKTSVSHMLMKRHKKSYAPGDHQVIYIKKSNVVTKEETDWKEIDISELMYQLTAITKLSSAHGLKTDGTVPFDISNQVNQEIWSIFIFLDIHVPLPTIHLLPNALVTFVVDKFHNVNDSFIKFNEDKSLNDKNLYFLKHVITANCLKQYHEKTNEFNMLEVHKGKNSVYTAFVGTCLSSDYAETKDIDNGLKHLLDNINSPQESLPALHLGNGKLLHLIDITNKADTIAENLHHTAKKYLENEATYKVPVEWLLLLVELKQFSINYKKPYIFFNDVYEKVWKATHNSSMIELKAALKFFNHLSVLLYYEKESNSESYIICCWEWLFKILSCLFHDPVPHIGNTFVSYNRFVYEGILTITMMQDTIWPFEKEIKMVTLIKLLVHLQLAVPIKSSEGTEYFLPGRLPIYDKSSNIISEYGEIQLEPLLIIVSSGTSHPSLFCLLVAHILEALPENWLTPQESSEVKRHTYSNLITFRIKGGYFVTLYEKSFFLEVQVRKMSSCKDININFHYQVLQTLKKALSEVNLRAHEIKYGFLCRVCPPVNNESNCHVMILKKLDLNCQDSLEVYCSKQNKSQEFYISDTDCTNWFTDHIAQNEKLKTPTKRDSVCVKPTEPVENVTDTSMDFEGFNVVTPYHRPETMPVEGIGRYNEPIYVRKTPDNVIYYNSENHINYGGITLVKELKTTCVEESHQNWKNPFRVFADEIQDVPYTEIDKYLIKEGLLSIDEQQKISRITNTDNEKQRLFRNVVLRYNLEECKKFLKCLESIDSFSNFEKLHKKLQGVLKLDDAKQDTK